MYIDATDRLLIAQGKITILTLTSQGIVLLLYSKEEGITKLQFYSLCFQAEALKIKIEAGPQKWQGLPSTSKPAT